MVKEWFLGRRGLGPDSREESGLPISLEHRMMQRAWHMVEMFIVDLTDLGHIISYVAANKRTVRVAC